MIWTIIMLISTAVVCGEYLVWLFKMAVGERAAIQGESK